jgi:hypothetical protein
MARNYYDILQIRPDASSEEIQHAYRRLALQYHPDHHPGANASSQMTAVNEAYEHLNHAAGPGSSNIEMTSSIFSAARAVILRHGWLESPGAGKDNVKDNVVLFEIGNPRVRIVLTDRLPSESVTRILRQHRDLAAVLAVHLDGEISLGPHITVVDLMHAEQHGAAIREAACKSLLPGFL